MALCEFQFLGFSTTKDGLKKAARRGNFTKKSGFRQQNIEQEKVEKIGLAMAMRIIPKQLG